MAVPQILSLALLVSSILVMSLVCSKNSPFPAATQRTLDWGPWTGWSVCSHTCGYGMAYRIRRCHAQQRQDGDPVCEGPSKQYTICNVKNCPDGHADYRTKECARHNDVLYGQQTYRWEPYINEGSPCELSCKSIGYGYYARFKESVEDGIICNEGNTAVCMEGKCVATGCDGVLGSVAQLDMCGSCGGDGSTCQIIRGIFTRTHLTERGYNIVATIPAGARSINITELSRSKNHLALSTSKGYFLNGDMRLQGEGRVNGAGTIFLYNRGNNDACPGECLSAPGPLNTSLRVELIYFGRNPGISYEFTTPRDTPQTLTQQQSTLVAEQKEDEQKDADPNVLRADVIPRIRHGKSPIYLPDNNGRGQHHQLKSSRQHTKQPTPTHDKKYHKLTDENGGKQTDPGRKRHNPPRGQANAKVEGQYQTTNEDLYLRGENKSIEYKHYYHTNEHDDLGDVPMIIPAEDTQSNTKGLNYKKEPVWTESNDLHDGRYAEFSGTTQYQPPERFSSLPAVIAASVKAQQNIAPIPPRANSISRIYNGYDNRLSDNPDKRHFYSWRISGFTACSEPCGGGLQETQIICIKGDSQVEVMEENCDQNTKPETTPIVCNNQPCEPSWDLGEWSQCSVTCGRGLQKRVVECKQRISHKLTISVSSTNCPQPQPQSRQYCQLEPCFTWKAAEWGKCSADCGFGQRTRNVKCVNTQDKVVSDSLCTHTKPTVEEICDMGSCASGWFHTRWSSDCSAECGKGHYSRQVYCSAADGAKLDEKKCGKKNKPREHKSCKSKKPCGGLWFTGPWSQCNVSCGPAGFRHRDVFCIKQHGSTVKHIVKEHNCAKEDKPSPTEACGPFPECKPQWFMTGFSHCSKSCGIGVKIREVKCLNSNHQPSPDCDKSKRPDRRQPCNMEPCISNFLELSETPLSTINEAIQMDRSAVATSAGHTACTDSQSSRWCQLVKQARLCHYSHYKNICCQTCRKLDPKPH
ncbi:unnamed protein product [Lymnaea stagnalis]|uniref:PLAC domain-containing protein n=1 Tax=Lymnaea stagnalis TaxID=6523 RepID=A0AAV2H121_LYMST